MIKRVLVASAALAFSAVLAQAQEVKIGLVAPFTGIGAEPSFAIGQRLLLAETPEGNVLWDMIPLVDDAAVDAVRSRGEVRAERDRIQQELRGLGLACARVTRPADGARDPATRE